MFMKQIKQGFHSPNLNILPNIAGFQSKGDRQNNVIIDQIFRP